jgi:U4/U6 small nuclear ribonucleoprotein PRP3
MADTASNLLKRPHPQDEQANSPKKSRSNNGSPRPVTNGDSASPRPDVNKILAEARAKAKAARARLQGAKGQSSASAVPSPSTPTPAAGSAQDRLAQMRARVAAATGRASAIAQQKPGTATQSYTPPAFDEGIVRARGGLDVGLHPALMADSSSQDTRVGKGRSIPGKVGSTVGSQQTESPAPATKKAQLDLSAPSTEEIKSNPYYDASLSTKNAAAKGRHSRQLVFNQKGKYIQQAAALRRQAQLEAMKKRIAEQARKAGIEEELDAEKAFIVSAPPALEWWDEGLVDGDSYDAIEDTANIKIDTEDSIITMYIQHPVLLEPPQEKIVPAPKPMFLTAKEQAKLRRQRRMADLKEQQAKIRLGLEPAPPPKVKKSNLMRVLGEEAVKDPTAVEARVNREIADRKNTHDVTNEERKLTEEQRHEKLTAQQQSDAAKGIFTNVYKIDSLANGRHRYKISINAEQNALTGVCIMHPKMNLVIVEGGAHSIRYYKKLMMNRIDWTENTGPNSVREGNKEALAKWLEAEDEKGELKDLSLNSCQLVFEGEEKQRAFRKWLGARVCESDAQAKDILGRAKMESFWNLAKSMKKVDID